MKVIIDTNILISAAIKDKIPEKVILWIVSRSDVLWIISKEIYNEYINVIKRPKFKLSEVQINLWTELILKSTKVINSQTKVDFHIDVLDSKFIECAIDSQSDYIITGDSHFDDVKNQYDLKVISVKDFFEKFVSK